jgi:sugar phosphate isomerase/epimerase
MGYSVIMHVNYCEQGQTVEEICKKAAAWGFDGVEFRRKRDGVEESTEEYLSKLERGVKASGLREVLFGAPGPSLIKQEARQRAREVEEAIAFYRHVAERFGVRTVNLMTGWRGRPEPVTDEEWAWQVDGCRDMADGLTDVRIRFGFETHRGYVHDKVPSTKKLVEDIDRPSIGANLDYGNMVGLEDRPSLEEAVRAFGKKLHYVHLKNSAALRAAQGRIATSLGEGEINNRQFVRLLMETGYDGPICTEAPRAGDREWFAQQDLAYIRSVLADLGA